MTKKWISIGEFNVQVQRKKVKRLTLTLKAEEPFVFLTIPYNYPEKEAIAFVLERVEWIKQNLEKVRKKYTRNHVNHTPYGDYVWVLGREYKLFYQKNLEKTVFDKKNNIIVISEEKGALEQLLYFTLRTLLIEYVEKYEKMMKLTIHKIHIHRMNTRWGSCNTRTKELNFNYDLIHYSSEAIEQVVCHEMCHLIVPSHQKTFYDVLSSYMPNWKENKELLK